PLDHATVGQCQANLAAAHQARVGRPRETNPAVLRCAFDEAVSKIFHQLVYEHLGYFLQSEEYHAHGSGSEPTFLEKALGLTKGASPVYVVEDAEACFHALLAHPVASYYFKGYLREVAATAEATGGTRRGGGRDRFPLLDRLECLCEMMDYAASRDPAHRVRRARLIILRYGKVAYGVEELMVMRNELGTDPDQAPAKYRRPDDQLFAVVYYRLSRQLLEEHLAGFFASPYYRALEEATA
ncbi:unnamed protein product, partial [Heterosigma akashiwo]